jgi:ribosome-binding protein aMBF1 (putative translation factor)
MSAPRPDPHTRLVNAHGETTHILVPAAEYAQLVASAAPHPPSAQAVQAATRALNDPATIWHDADAVLTRIVRDGLERARRERGLTQQQLGKLLGIPQSQVSRLERNPESTTLKRLKRIADLLAGHPPINDN